MPKFVKLPVSRAVVDTERITGYTHYYYYWDWVFNSDSVASAYSQELGAYNGTVLAIHMSEGQTINIRYGDKDQGKANCETDVIFLQKFLTITQEE